MKHTDYTVEFYRNQLSANLWVQSMDINKDIIEIISQFSMGLSRECDNEICRSEVNLSNGQDINLLSKIRSAILEGEIDGIMKIINDHKHVEDVYYFDEDIDILYCKDCVQSGKQCEDGGWMVECIGVIFEKAKNSYINCACDQKAKLCLNDDHDRCNKCNLAFCYQGCMNIENEEDLCVPRTCSICGANGCPQCVPMVYFDHGDWCDPPAYYGEEWECYNNPDCKKI